MRDTPPDIQDGTYGEQSGSRDSSGYDDASPEEEGGIDVLPDDVARKLARSCYESSTQWINSGRRAKWSDSLRAFQGLHPSGSKYLSNDYRYRSRMFRPKTRAMVRRDEALTAAAFFANGDMTNIEPQDDNDPLQLASAHLMQEILQYRLTKSIPWFQTLIGARQDANLTGVAIAKCYWKYSERVTGTDMQPVIDTMTGMPMFDEDGTISVAPVERTEIYEDKPCVDLVPPENFRFDPASDWRNPVETSPYLIHLVPMYLADVKAKVASGEWLPVAESAMRGSSDLDDDQTRRSREQGRVPGKDSDSWRPHDFSICWVRENIIRYMDNDWHYYTLGFGGELLTKPKLLKDVYLHGVRPFVVGNVIIEAHKSYPSGKVELVRELQMAANDVWNLRFDNVKLALNPRQFVAQGSGADPNDVRSFVPGKVISVKNPGQDIVWDRPPEVTASSYQEQDRINMDFDELAGDFGASTIAGSGNPILPETVGGMDHLAAPAASMVEYEMRVFSETFVEPVLRQLVKLEQAYETNEVILALAGQNAQLFQKFGINDITDELLNQELTCRVNVGIGATNPKTRLQNLASAGEILGKLYGPLLPQALNFDEVSKEVFGLLGYTDGSRFLKPGFNMDAAMKNAQAMGGKGHAGAPAGNQQMVQAKIGLEQQRLQQQTQQEQVRAQYEQQDDQRTFQLEQTKHDQNLQMEQARFQLEQQKVQGDLALQREEMLGRLQLQREKMQAEMLRHALSEQSKQSQQSIGAVNV